MDMYNKLQYSNIQTVANAVCYFAFLSVCPLDIAHKISYLQIECLYYINYLCGTAYQTL